MQDPRRSTPRTDHVLSDPRLREAADRLGSSLVKRVVVATLERCRTGEIAASDVADHAVNALPEAPTGMRRVLNATGVVVHTNLGRAPLSPAAIEAMVVAAGSTDVELDLDTGRRGRRGRSALTALARAVPEAEAVHVVNNGAAALALVTSALARCGNIVVARGEMVEIGDGFRIPELLESVGATLREVGTTNRVHLSDYERAVDGRTAFVLKVHPSNFVVRGFTSSVPVGALATLSVPVVADIGSGLLTPHPRLPAEPSASRSLTDGADLVTASGDKLLGGPQCGLMLGKSELVERLRRNPFARALRVDKLTLAALEATLTGPPSPVAQALVADPGQLLARAVRISSAVADLVPATADVSVAAIGGGGAPEVELPSAAVALPTSLSRSLRLGRPAVVGYVSKGQLLLDLITIPAEEDDTLVHAVRRAATQPAQRSSEDQPCM